jgi:hypothetical protein
MIAGQVHLRSSAGKVSPELIFVSPSVNHAKLGRVTETNNILFRAFYHLKNMQC